MKQTDQPVMGHASVIPGTDPQRFNSTYTVKQAPIWVAYDNGSSTIAVFHAEIDALRWAVTHNRKVKPVQPGEELNLNL